MLTNAVVQERREGMRSSVSPAGKEHYGHHPHPSIARLRRFLGGQTRFRAIQLTTTGFYHTEAGSRAETMWTLIAVALTAPPRGCVALMTTDGGAVPTSDAQQVILESTVAGPSWNTPTATGTAEDFGWIIVVRPLRVNGRW